MPNDSTASAPYPTMRPRTHFVAAATAVLLLLAVAFVGMDLLQVRDIDNGIAEAVAVEQDGYVQLVLDQINLQPDRTDEEVIDDILGTLDSNAGHYWTFSRDNTMLFVKDASETSRYRSLMADAYFESGSGRDFLDELSEDRVIHDVITIEGEQFVASGAPFRYAGSTYRLCLLTNRDAMLSSNTMLGSRSRLMVLLYVELGTFLVVSIYLAILTQRARDAERGARERESRLGESVERLNAHLLEIGRGAGAPSRLRAGESGEPTAEDAADARGAQPQGHEPLAERLVPLLERRTSERGVPCEKITVACDSEASRRGLVERAGRLGPNVLAFSDGADRVVLVRVGSEGEPLYDQVAAILGPGTTISEG
jgi:hypothetical protein